MHFRHKNDIKLRTKITRELGFIGLKQATPCLSVYFNGYTHSLAIPEGKWYELGENESI